MMNANRNILTSIIALFSLCFFSCKKMIEVELPRNQVTTGQVFTDSLNANAAVTGLYVRMMGSAFTFSFANGGITAFTGLYTDELYATRNNPLENEFYTNSVTQDNSTLAELWKNAYTIIYQANAVIEGLSESKTVPVTVKKKFTGEAKLVRAFIYFNLINLFGDVPYIVSTDYRSTAIMPRTSDEQVYKSIEDDLMEAADLLPAAYMTVNKVRPNKFAALSLLARVHLYRGKWMEAEMISTQIINTGSYVLQNDLSKVFNIGGSEAIWQMPPVQPGGFETTEGMMFVPFVLTSPPNYPLNTNLLSAFENGDRRKEKWTGENIVSGQSYYYPLKYKLNFSGASTVQEHYMIFRLAEQYLIRSEARAQQNKIADALSDLNKIRNRAGLSDTTGTTAVDLLALVLHERQVELFCEWGHRWYDLKRLKKADNILGIIKSQGWQPHDKLLPIPFREMQLNPSLIQNPGYQ